jgi:hypothetical protein
VPWYWDRKMDEVFTHIKKLLADKVEEGIKSFDRSRVTALFTDWCKHGDGFVMMQKHCPCPAKQDGTPDMLCCSTGWQVCMVGSRFTHTAEANYSAKEGELLVIILSQQKYLKNLFKPMVINILFLSFANSILLILLYVIVVFV